MGFTPAGSSRQTSTVSPDATSTQRHVLDRALDLELTSSTAVAPTSVTFRARLDAELAVADSGPWGGYIAALFTKAIGEAVPELPVMSLTVHFLRRLRVGDADVHVSVEARGSRVGHVVARITQE